MNNQESKFIVCECFSLEHLVCLSYFEGDDEAYIHIHLAQETFWTRVWHALKYIFGYRCRYGDFDEFLIGPKNVTQFKQFFDRVSVQILQAERKRCHELTSN